VNDAAESHRPEVYWRGLIPIALGLSSALIAAMAGTADLSVKAILGAIIALAGTAVAVSVARCGAGARMLVLLLALFIPFNLTKNFFVTPHVGGSPGLQVQAAGVVMALLYGGLITNMVLRRPIAWGVDRAMTLSIVVYLVACLLSSFGAFYPIYSVFELIRLLQLFLTFLLVSQFRDEQKINLFLLGLSVGVVLEALLAVIQYKTGKSLGLGVFGEGAIVTQNIGHSASRATGTIGHPNQLAYFFEILIPVMLAMALAHRNRILRWIFLGGFIAGVVGILTTLSRAGWLTLPVTLAIVIASVVGRKAFSLRGAQMALVTFAVCIAGAIAAYPTIEKRFTHNDYQSAESREPLNEAAFSIVGQYPIVGVGLNNFAEIFHEEDLTGKARRFRGPDSNKQIRHYKQVVHNMYFLVWTELGTVGLIAFLIQFFVPLSLVFFGKRHPLEQWQALRIGIAAGLLAQLIHGLADPGFKTTFNISLEVYCLLGLLAALNQYQPAPDSTPIRIEDAH
jgi:putative inorganic carbon (HCO3(-)) transporter